MVSSTNLIAPNGKKLANENVKDKRSLIGDFHQDSLAAHNECRKKHNVPPLKWSDTLAKNAQNWADHLGKHGKFEHADMKSRKGEGENIFCSQGKELDGYSATMSWYSEIEYYDFACKPTFNPNAGHFTQVVWAETAELGVGRSKAKNGMEFVVARYSPMGNHLNKFEDNIKPPVAILNGHCPDKSTSDSEVTSDEGVENHGSCESSEGESSSTCTLHEVSLRAHNECRKKHGVQPLTWCDHLAKNAQNWADHIARHGKLEHADISQRKGEGENIFCSEGKAADGQMATMAWYSEIDDYDFTCKPKRIPGTGHFTQVVWAATTKLGVGQSKADNGMEFIVARYTPMGNIMNKFERNIRPPLPEDASDEGYISGLIEDERDHGEKHLSSLWELQFKTKKCKETYDDDTEELRTIEVIQLSEPVDQEPSYLQRENVYLELGKTYIITHGFYL